MIVWLDLCYIAVIITLPVIAIDMIVDFLFRKYLYAYV